MSKRKKSVEEPEDELLYLDEGVVAEDYPEPVEVQGEDWPVDDVVPEVEEVEPRRERGKNPGREDRATLNLDKPKNPWSVADAGVRDRMMGK